MGVASRVCEEQDGGHAQASRSRLLESARSMLAEGNGTDHKLCRAAWWAAETSHLLGNVAKASPTHTRCMYASHNCKPFGVLVEDNGL